MYPCYFEAIFPLGQILIYFIPNTQLSEDTYFVSYSSQIRGVINVQLYGNLVGNRRIPHEMKEVPLHIWNEIKIYIKYLMENGKQGRNIIMNVYLKTLTYFLSLSTFILIFLLLYRLAT